MSLFYLSNAGNPAVTSTLKWICIAAILVIYSLDFNGNPKQMARAPQQVTPVPVETTEEIEEETSNVEIPEPVTEDSLDGATLRERKLAKIQSAQAAQEEMLVAEVEQEELNGEEMVEVTIEDVHVADEFVVEVSPESVENADIEMSIHKKSSMTKFERRSKCEGGDNSLTFALNCAWEEQTAGEDLINSANPRSRPDSSIHLKIQHQATCTVQHSSVLMRLESSNLERLWMMDSNR